MKSESDLQIQVGLLKFIMGSEFRFQIRVGHLKFIYHLMKSRVEVGRPKFLWSFKPMPDFKVRLIPQCPTSICYRACRIVEAWLHLQVCSNMEARGSAVK